MRAPLLFLALAGHAVVCSAQAAADWRTGPLTAGSWAYRGLADASEAVFTDARVAQRILVKCSRSARQITFIVASPVPASAITLASTEMQRSIPAKHDAQTAQIVAQIAANDGLLDALAFSRGRFAVMVPGGATLVVPAGPEVARSIEDCRN